MTKYNYKGKKEKHPYYSTAINPEEVDRICELVLYKMQVEKKYRNPKYSAKQLAKEIETDARYLSGSLGLRFQKNYAELVNGYRMRDAIGMLTNKNYLHLDIQQICTACGFNTRQSFYAYFFRMYGTSPKKYRDQFLTKAKLPKRLKKKASE